MLMYALLIPYLKQIIPVIRAHVKLIVFANNIIWSGSHLYGMQFFAGIFIEDVYKVGLICKTVPANDIVTNDFKVISVGYQVIAPP